MNSQLPHRQRIGGTACEGGVETPQGGDGCSDGGEVPFGQEAEALATGEDHSGGGGAGPPSPAAHRPTLAAMPTAP